MPHDLEYKLQSSPTKQLLGFHHPISTVKQKNGKYSRMLLGLLILPPTETSQNFKQLFSPSSYGWQDSKSFSKT